MRLLMRPAIMRQPSLRFRLLMAWLVFIVLILGASAFGLRLLFERSILYREIAELTLDVRRLAKGLEIGEAGVVRLSDAPQDPQYVAAYSGRYWQISVGGVAALRSPSLWGSKLDLARTRLSLTAISEVRIPGPDDQNLIGVGRLVQVGDGERTIEVAVVAAIDDAEMRAAAKKFASDMTIALAGLAALLFAAAAAHVSIGLRPLADLRARLAAVRSGEHTRLDGSFPNEVMPLVTETNALLDAQDEALALARTRASNLAHGLKTPLAVMATQSRTLRRRGDVALAEGIDRQVETMRRHVERELARTRERGTGSARYRRIDAGRAIGEIVSALKNLAKGQQLAWDVSITEAVELPVDRADFIDIMGNLLDNAQKWAATRVAIEAHSAGRMVVFTVADDGPGVAGSDLERILQRGERADTSVPGTGLGLAIVNDLVQLYGGTLKLSRATLGGLQVVVELPGRH